MVGVRSLSMGGIFSYRIPLISANLPLSSLRMENVLLVSFMAGLYLPGPSSLVGSV